MLCQHISSHAYTFTHVDRDQHRTVFRPHRTLNDHIALPKVAYELDRFRRGYNELATDITIYNGCKLIEPDEGIGGHGP